MMPFEVDGHICALSIELVGRLADLRSRLPRACAMLIDTVRDTYMNALGILSAY
jgi:hypothetical protein